MGFVKSIFVVLFVISAGIFLIAQICRKIKDFIYPPSRVLSEDQKTDMELQITIDVPEADVIRFKKWSDHHHSGDTCRGFRAIELGLYRKEGSMLKKINDTYYICTNPKCLRIFTVPRCDFELLPRW